MINGHILGGALIAAGFGATAVSIGGSAGVGAAKAPVTHYLDPSSGLNVIVDPAGNFVSGWRLGAEQLKNVLTHGGL